MTRSCFTAFFLVLFLGVQLVLGSSSGATTASQNRRLITGGSPVVNRARYPYFTHIHTAFDVYDRLHDLWCAGTLIAPDVVMTSAHCVIDYDFNLAGVDVRVNSTTVKYSPQEYYRKPARVVVHPKYQGRESPNKQSANNIALIFLLKPLKDVPTVQINRNASIPVSSNPPPLTSIGFGEAFVRSDPDIGYPFTGSRTTRRMH